jgi:hypothetical protein
MEKVLENMPAQVPLWSAAIDGRADWKAIYDGCTSAVDWPTACFYRELLRAFPSARFVLTHRSPDSWAESFSSTIQKLLGQRRQAPAELQDWLEMAERVIEKTGFAPGLDVDRLKRAFVAHNEAVKAAIPARQLLVYEVRDGWGPLCEFLRVPVPEEPFPRSNDRSEFWDLVQGKSKS